MTQVSDLAPRHLRLRGRLSVASKPEFIPDITRLWIGDEGGFAFTTNFLDTLAKHRPFLTAKAMTSLDVLSDGRTDFVVGAGYLRSEFSALGVDFEERNSLFEEAIEVIRATWLQATVSYEGREFRAIDQATDPAPTQMPHPPLWIGGNARTVRERVANHGTGWAPLPGPAAQSARTPTISSLEDLRSMIDDLQVLMEVAGRDSRQLKAVYADPCPNLRLEMEEGERIEGLLNLGKAA